MTENDQDEHEMYCLITKADQTIDLHTQADCFLSGLVIATVPFGNVLDNRAAIQGTASIWPASHDVLVTSICLQVPLWNSLTMVAVTCHLIGGLLLASIPLLTHELFNHPNLVSHSSYFRQHPVLWAWDLGAVMLNCCPTEGQIILLHKGYVLAEGDSSTSLS